MTHDRLTYGVTIRQLDELSIAIEKISALGDIITVSDDRPGDDRSLFVLGEMIYNAARTGRGFVRQVNAQRIENAGGNAVPAEPTDLPAFASDMLGSLLRAHTIMLEMKNSDHRSDGTGEVGDSCRIVSKLLWRVSKYVMENFDTSSGPDDEP